jgi:thymidine kinase
MNAGKTTKLLQSNFNYLERGMGTLLYTFKLDNRFGEVKIASRIGLESEANKFDADLNMFTDVLEKKTSKTSCVFVDEAQFLTKKHVLELCQVVDELDIPVLAFGLRSDFLGEPFEGSKYLLIFADELIELKTICHCGRKAIMNARFDDNKKIARSGEQVVIGGNEQYTSLCRKHFIRGVVDPS